MAAAATARRILTRARIGWVRGTGLMGRLFGPITLLWFVALAVLGSLLLGFAGGRFKKTAV